jgi:hypothetical protein
MRLSGIFFVHIMPRISMISPIAGMKTGQAASRNLTNGPQPSLE